MFTRMPFFFFAAIDVTDLNYSTGITMASFSGINESKTAGSNGREKMEEVRQLSVQQIHWLLEGLSIHQPKAIKAGTKGFF